MFDNGTLCSITKKENLAGHSRKISRITTTNYFLKAICYFLRLHFPESPAGRTVRIAAAGVGTGVG